MVGAKNSTQVASAAVTAAAVIPRGSRLIGEELSARGEGPNHAEQQRMHVMDLANSITNGIAGVSYTDRTQQPYSPASPALT